MNNNKKTAMTFIFSSMISGFALLDNPKFTNQNSNPSNVSFVNSIENRRKKPMANSKIKPNKIKLIS